MNSAATRFTKTTLLVVLLAAILVGNILLLSIVFITAIYITRNPEDTPAKSKLCNFVERLNVWLDSKPGTLYGSIYVAAIVSFPLTAGIIIESWRLRNIATEDIRTTVEAASMMPAGLMFTSGMVNLVAAVILAALLYFVPAILSSFFKDRALPNAVIFSLIWTGLFIIAIYRGSLGIEQDVYALVALVLASLLVTATVILAFTGWTETQGPATKLKRLFCWFLPAAGVILLVTSCYFAFQPDLRMGCIQSHNPPQEPETAPDEARGVDLGETGGTIFYLNTSTNKIKPMREPRSDVFSISCGKLEDIRHQQ